MSFGPIMCFSIGELSIELAPLTKEVMSEFVNPGMQQLGVRMYTGSHIAPVLEDECEWYEKVRTDRSQLLWGIWLIKNDTRTLLGVSSLTHIQTGHVHKATSASMIFRKEYWGKGIASGAHKARTWYAFQHMGLHKIDSQVIQGNEGSAKALSRSGYVQTHTHRNETFIDGQLRHLDNFECLNPTEPFWSQWWHGDQIPEGYANARMQTQDVLAWAKQNVTLP